MKKIIFVVVMFLMVSVLYSQEITLEQLKIVDGTAWLGEKTYSGKCEGMHPNGKLMYSGKFKSGLKTGLWTEWDADGMKTAEELWKNGKREGQATYYYPHGSYKEQGLYKDDWKQGVWTEWDPLGKDIKQRNYILKTENYPSGTIQNQGLLKDGNKHGTWTSYTEDGFKKQEVNYNEGKIEGLLVYYDEKARKKKSETYLNDMLQGEYLEFNDEGKISIKGYYTKGYKDSI